MKKMKKFNYKSLLKPAKKLVIPCLSKKKTKLFLNNQIFINICFYLIQFFPNQFKKKNIFSL